MFLLFLGLRLLRRSSAFEFRRSVRYSSSSAVEVGSSSAVDKGAVLSSSCFGLLGGVFSAFELVVIILHYSGRGKESNFRFLKVSCSFCSCISCSF